MEMKICLKKRPIAFYKPFPMKKMGIPSLAKYIMETLSGADYGMMVLAALAVTFVGMLTPKINQLIFSEVLPSEACSCFCNFGFYGVHCNKQLAF